MKEETLLKRLTKLSLLAVSLSLALPVAADDSADANTVVATVNGTEITLGHMILARWALPEQYSNYPAEMLFEGLLDQLVQQTLLAQSTSHSTLTSLISPHDLTSPTPPWYSPRSHPAPFYPPLTKPTVATLPIRLNLEQRSEC